MTDDPQWMDISEGARRAGVTERHLYELIDRAVLPAYRSGGTIWLRIGDLERVLARPHPPDDGFEDWPDGTSGTNGTK
jgi:excisionase family DNA binding protein